MKNKTTLLLISLIILSTDFFYGQTVDWENKIIGKWTLTEANDTEAIFFKTDEFIKRKFGIAFLKNGEFIHYSFSGWCGTPPLHFSNNKGKWNKAHEQVLEVNYRMWNGIKEGQIFIKEVSEDSLIIQWSMNKSEN